ncbi:toll/interleukin-1 receptor domain-containing protein [Methylococcaceae bacterium WWC4]|nr:toll/interleukin-1 receptor domain-containing protein [Methylococcaceae bacterium WWC4]
MDWRWQLGLMVIRGLANWLGHESDLSKLKDNPVRVFLAHASEDKAIVRKIYATLLEQPGVKPWMDENEILPGQDWDRMISESLENAQIALICLTNQAIKKLSTESYFQREVNTIVDRANKKVSEEILIIPVLLESCVPPKLIARWQWASLDDKRGYNRLLDLIVEKSKLLNSVTRSSIAANYAQE